jgi:F-type H+-transporting ATPase subunit a
MGEHGTWFDYLNRFSWWPGIADKLHGALGRGWSWMMFGPQDSFTLTHVFNALAVVLFVIIGAVIFWKGTRGEQGLVPPRKMSFRHFFEVLAEAVYGMTEGAMGAENAPRYFPLVAAFWFYILFANLIGLIPGFSSPDHFFANNIVLALFVFVMTHVYGVREHGLAYFKHFLGPVWWLAPLMLPLEIISHLARPLSLTLRLLGNMLADHKVLISFFTLMPFFVPVPFYLLGILVCVVQAFVFCTLALTYFSMAVAHEEH